MNEASVKQNVAVGTGHPGAGLRGRRAVPGREVAAADPERADHRRRRPPAGARGGAAAGRVHRPHRLHGLDRRPDPRPRGAGHRRPDLDPGRQGDAGPDPQRHRRAGRRARRGRRQGHRADPRAGTRLRRPVDRGRGAGHRHQGRRPAHALPQGRQDRPVRRCRRRQDRADHGADQQHRQGAWRRVGVRRRRRADPRGQRPLSRDDRVRASSTSRSRSSPRCRWSTAR